MSNIFIGIDPSGGTKPIGLAILHNGRALCKEEKTPYDVSNALGGDCIVGIEEGFASGNARSTRMLERQRGMLLAYCEMRQAQAVHFIHPNTWRALMLPKSEFPERKTKALKKAAQAVALRETGKQMKEDIADAYCIARYVQECYRLDVELTNELKR